MRSPKPRVSVVSIPIVKGWGSNFSFIIFLDSSVRVIVVCSKRRQIFILNVFFKQIPSGGWGALRHCTSVAGALEQVVGRILAPGRASAVARNPPPQESPDTDSGDGPGCLFWMHCELPGKMSPLTHLVKSLLLRETSGKGLNR